MNRLVELLVLIEEVISSCISDEWGFGVGVGLQLEPELELKLKLKRVGQS